MKIIKYILGVLSVGLIISSNAYADDATQTGTITFNGFTDSGLIVYSGSSELTITESKIDNVFSGTEIKIYHYQDKTIKCETGAYSIDGAVNYDNIMQHTYVFIGDFTMTGNVTITFDSSKCTDILNPIKIKTEDVAGFATSTGELKLSTGGTEFTSSLVKPGTDLTITGTTSGENYRLKEINYTYKDSSNTEQTGSIDINSLTFKMPTDFSVTNSGVEITGVIEFKHEVTFSGTGFTVKSGTGNNYSGDKVTLVVEATGTGNATFTGSDVDNFKVTGNGNSYTITFEMKKVDVVINGTLKTVTDGHKVKVGSVSGGEITLKVGDSAENTTVYAASGDTVTVNAVADTNTNCTLKEIKYSYGTVEEVLSGTTDFTMVDADVTVTGEFTCDSSSSGGGSSSSAGSSAGSTGSDTSTGTTDTATGTTTSAENTDSNDSTDSTSETGTDSNSNENGNTEDDSAEDKPIFSDVTAGTFAKDYIEFLYKKGIVKGYEDGTYRPDNNVTRAELLKMALGAAGKDNGTDKSSKHFDDIEADTWEARVTNTAVELGSISTENKKFRPTDAITRAEAMKIIINIMGFKKSEATKSSYTDVTGWAVAYVETAKELGLIAANDTFRPEDNITRAEVAKVLTLAMRVEKTPEDTASEDTNSKKVVPTDESNTGSELTQIANPASEYCVAQGGESFNKEDSEGNQIGMCKLSDGTEVEEWEYYRANNSENTESTEETTVSTEETTNSEETTEATTSEETTENVENTTEENKSSEGTENNTNSENA